IQKFHGFYHVKNNNGIDFMKYLQAKKQEKHSVLILKKTNVEQCTMNQVEEASQQVFEQFIALHNHVFPNTYYEGNEIIGR
ncbi:GNAT family N-acetyltransferase, partial [Klebsiella pneumoniae]|nr:GNAT family N-acetyltransferase [Klebsiella pneumoniae]